MPGDHENTHPIPSAQQAGESRRRAAEESWAQQDVQARARAAETRRIVEEENALIANDPGRVNRWLEELDHEEGLHNGGGAEFGWAFIIGAAIALLLLITTAFSSKTKDSSSSNNARNQDDQEDSAPENAFALSSERFQSAYDALWGIAGSTAGWAGDSGTRFTGQNTAFRNLLAEITDLSQEVDTTVQTEDKQVNDSRETLENVLGELDLAVPVAQSLYFSGPAGPALSYSFQLAVSSPAIDTGVDTTNTMHENSQRHGNRLTALFERYDEAFRSL